MNEDNVDLNRNFVDHGNAKPANPGYDALRDVICPKEWTEESEQRNLAALRAYAAQHGADALETAIASGQYVDAQGVFYGGTQPTWSNRTLRAILKPFAATARQVAFIDLHTGLGPYGFGEIMSNHGARDPGHQIMQRWWGSEATYFDDGTSSSYYVVGDTQIAVTQTLTQGADRRHHAGIRHHAPQGRHDERGARRQLALCPRRPCSRPRAARSRPRSAPRSTRSTTTGRRWWSSAATTS